MAKVLKGFRDGKSGLDYKVGDNYEDERVEELIDLGYLEGAKKRTTKKESE